MTPQISASISAASIRELLFLDALWTAGTPAPRWPQLGQPTCLGVHETASAIPLLPLPSGRGSVTELKSSGGIILGLKLFLFIYSSRRTRITLSLRARVTRHSSGHKALCLLGPHGRNHRDKTFTHALLPAVCSRGSRQQRSPGMDVSPLAALALALLFPHPSCPGVPWLLSPTCTPRRLQRDINTSLHTCLGHSQGLLQPMTRGVQSHLLRWPQ